MSYEIRYFYHDDAMPELISQKIKQTLPIVKNLIQALEKAEQDGYAHIYLYDSKDNEIECLTEDIYYKLQDISACLNQYNALINNYDAEFKLHNGNHLMMDLDVVKAIILCAEKLVTINDKYFENYDQDTVNFMTARIAIKKLITDLEKAKNNGAGYVDMMNQKPPVLKDINEVMAYYEKILATAETNAEVNENNIYEIFNALVTYQGKNNSIRYFIAYKNNTFNVNEKVLY